QGLRRNAGLASSIRRASAQFTCKQRDAQRLKVGRRYHAGFGNHTWSRVGTSFSELEFQLLPIAHSRQSRGDRHFFDTRKRRDSVDDAVDTLYGTIGRFPPVRAADGERQDTIGVEPEIHTREGVEG